MVCAVEHGADKFRHAGVDDQQSSSRSRSLVEEYAGDEFAALAHDRTPELEVHLAVAYVEVFVYDREERREIGYWFVLWYVVVYAKAAAHIYHAERESVRTQLLDDGVDLVAHVLEDVQLAYLRAYVQVQAYDVDVFKRLDQLGVFENLVIRYSELAVGLSGVDAVVGLGVDVGVDAQAYVDAAAHFGGYGVDHLQLLDRLAVQCQNVLLDGVAYLLVTLAYTGIYYCLGVESEFYCFVHLVGAGAVDAKAVLADYRQQMVVIVGLYRVVDLVVVFFRLRDHAVERLPKKIYVIKIKRSLQLLEL